MLSNNFRFPFEHNTFVGFYTQIGAQFLGGGANIHIYMTTCTFYMATCLYILAFNVDFEMAFSKTINSILLDQNKRASMTRNILLKRALIDSILLQYSIAK